MYIRLFTYLANCFLDKQSCQSASPLPSGSCRAAAALPGSPAESGLPYTLRAPRNFDTLPSRIPPPPPSLGPFRRPFFSIDDEEEEFDCKACTGHCRRRQRVRFAVSVCVRMRYPAHALTRPDPRHLILEQRLLRHL